jgi:protein SCO1
MRRGFWTFANNRTMLWVAGVGVLCAIVAAIKFLPVRPIVSVTLPVSQIDAPTSTDATFQVVAANPADYSITVKGPGLPSPGPDGTEVLKVGAGDAGIGFVGHQVHGDLSQSDGAWRLDNVWPADPELLAATDAATKQMHRDYVEMGRQSIRDVGDSLPSFALFNQNGELVRPSTLSGRRLVINFIFTRCANPNMCPANSQRMVALQKAVKAANIDNVTFVTISFDPEHDTPGVLRQYAEGYGMDLSNFQLLTGPPDEMTEALIQFGISIREDNGTLIHSMATLIVSPEGRITYRKPGELWTVDEFLDRLRPSAPAPAENTSAN